MHLNVVPLAGVLTDFYREYHRNYSWGMGYSVKAGLNWALANDKFSVKVANQFYKIITKNNFDSNFIWHSAPGLEIEIEGGDRGNSSFNHLEGAVNYKLHNNIYITGGIDYYIRTTWYDNMKILWKHPNNRNSTECYPCVQSKQLGTHLMLTYKF